VDIYDANCLNQYTAVGPQGSQTDYLYDANGNLSDDGSYVEYSYDGRGLKTAERRHDEVASHDRWIEYVHDDMGRQAYTLWHNYGDLSVSPVVKQEVTEHYNSGKKKYEYFYGAGASPEKTTYYEYDILDRMTQYVVDPGDGKLNLTTDYGYDDAGNLTYKVAPEGNGEGEAGNYIFYDYDNANRRKKEYFAEPWSTSIATTKANAAKKKEVTYYKNNLVHTVTEYDHGDDGHSNDTVLAYKEFTYDAMGRIRKVSEDIDRGPTPKTVAETNFTYKDKCNTYFSGEPGNTAYHLEIADADGFCTYISYDAFGNTAGILYPSNQYEVYEYNHGDGTLKWKTVFDPTDSDDPEKEITYSYDGYGRLRRTYYPPDNDSYYLEYFYDGFARTTKVLDKRNDSDRMGGTHETGAEILYAYDVLDRISSVTNQDGWRTDYTYCSDGQRKTVSVYDTSTPPMLKYDVAYTYDAALRLEDVYETKLGTNHLIADFDYDDNGNREKLTCSMDGGTTNAVWIDYDYDLDNRLRKFATSGGPTFTFGGTVGTGSDWADVDGLGRLGASTEQVTTADETPSTVTYNFTHTYDMRSQLTGATVSQDLSWSGSYTYYYNGNMASRTRTGESSQTTFKYDKFNRPSEDDCHLLTDVSGDETFTPSWDENGNMTEGRTANYDFEYNWDNKLRKVVTTGPTTVIALKYDPDGNRIYKDSGGTVRKYIVDIVGDLPVILMELDGSAVKKAYIYANGQILAQHHGVVAEGNKRFYLHDRLGSVRQIIKYENGQVKVVDRYTYTPFGETHDSQVQQDADLKNRFMFAGQYYDDEIKQYYLRARQYDPYIARFTARDPLLGQFEDPLTLHRYLYCRNDPIDKTDPTGERTYTELMAAVAGRVTALAYTGISSFWKVWHLAQRIPVAARIWWMRLNFWAAQFLGKSWCFPADTVISTTEGDVPIAEVNVGDLVWSYDTKTGQTERSRVVNIFKRRAERVVALAIGNDVLEVTPEHPFWIPQRGWVRAGELVGGDSLLTCEGEVLKISETKPLQKKVDVYNIEVDGYHNYFVSRQRVLVHNKARVNLPGRGASGKEVFRFLAKHGFRWIRNKGSHRIMKGPLGQIIYVPFHGSKSLAPGTLNNILRNAGFK
ncbi:MAG: polymorphic toxin-type HINT domain-containing protein, partial [Planctomycetota bacterium]